MNTVQVEKLIKDLEAQEDVKEMYKKSQHKRIKTDKKQVQSKVLQVPVAQKDVAGEKDMRVKRHRHSPKTKEISSNLSMKRKRGRSRSPEQTSMKGKRRKG